MSRKDSEFFFPKHGPTYWGTEHQALLRAHELANRRPAPQWPGAPYMPPPLWQPPIISPRPVVKGPTYAPVPSWKPPLTPEELEFDRKARRWLLLIAGCLCLFVKSLAPIGLCLLAFWLWQVTAERRRKKKEAEALDAALAAMFRKQSAPPKPPGRLRRLIAAIKARRALAREAKKAKEAKQAKPPAAAVDKILCHPPLGYWTASSVTALSVAQFTSGLGPAPFMKNSPLFKSLEPAPQLAPWEISLWRFTERASAVIAAIGRLL